MNEKITIQDLVNVLAEKHGMGRSEAELFIKGMFDLIEEALATEKYVKVKGLGIFKLTEVDSRESVNVNTGERIEIQGHNKITFTPDASLKELINKPFSHFETVVLNEETTFEDMPSEAENTEESSAFIEETTEEEPMEEVVAPVEEAAIPQEEPATPVEETEETPEPMEEEVTEIVEEPVAPVIEETVERIEETVDETAETEPVEPVVEEKPAEEPVTEEKEEEENKEEEVPSPQPTKEEDEKTSKGLIFITILLILLILGGFYWMFFSGDFEEAAPPQETPAAVVESQEISQDTIAKTVVEVEQEEPAEVKQETPVDPKETAPAPTIVKEEKVASLADTLAYRIVGTKATHTLQPGETIIRVSLKYYGGKNFWPYIAKYNEKTIKNANNVPVGTKLLIPELAPKE